MNNTGKITDTKNLKIEITRDLLSDRSYMDCLKPREKTVLDMRTGLGKSRRYTLIEVGRELGLTPERIRQIESKAINKISEYQILDRNKRIEIVKKIALLLSIIGSWNSDIYKIGDIYITKNRYHRYQKDEEYEEL